MDLDVRCSLYGNYKRWYQLIKVGQAWVLYGTNDFKKKKNCRRTFKLIKLGLGRFWLYEETF
jgi:hypothetical protein